MPLTDAPKHIVVWLPLPAHSSWRGEGIIQTVEQILAHAPAADDAPQWTLVVSPAHKNEVHQDVIKHPRITVRALFGLGSPGRKHQYSSDQLIRHMIRPTLWQRLTQMSRHVRVFGTAKKWIDLSRYAVMLTLHTYWQSLGWSFRGTSIWVPTPIIPLAHRLKGPKTCSFWDPFIFEYAAFRDTGSFFLPQFLRLFAAADNIITQSDYNRRYLSKVMNAPSRSINVIKNGTNDYSKHKIPDTVAQTEREHFILSHFGRSVFFGPLSVVAQKFIDQMLAKSVLMRIIERKNSLASPKIIFVSTQYRPHKGMHELLETATQLIEAEDDATEYLFIFTAKLPLQVVSKYPRLHEHTYELTRLSNKDHALIYQLADLVVHPSHAEGGLPYPIHEAASLGVASLVNDGRHMREALRAIPELGVLTFDISKPRKAAREIRDVLASPERQTKMLAAAKVAERPWAVVAQDYANLLTQIAPGD